MTIRSHLSLHDVHETRVRIRNDSGPGKPPTLWWMELSIRTGDPEDPVEQGEVRLVLHPAGGTRGDIRKTAGSIEIDLCEGVWDPDLSVELDVLATEEEVAAGSDAAAAIKMTGSA